MRRSVDRARILVVALLRHRRDDEQRSAAAGAARHSPRRSTWRDNAGPNGSSQRAGPAHRPALDRTGIALRRPRGRQRHPHGDGPGTPGHARPRGGRVRFTPDKGGHDTRRRAARDGRDAKTDADEGGPSKIGFDDGKGVATMIERGDRFALRVSTATRRPGPASAASRIGRVGLSGGSTGASSASAGHDPRDRQHREHGRKVPNPGAVEFTRDGKTHRLEGWTRATSSVPRLRRSHQRKESYPAGRYLYAPLREAENHDRFQRG